MKTLISKSVKEIKVSEAVAQKLQNLGVKGYNVENYTKIEDYETLMRFSKLIVDPERITQAVLHIDIKGKSYYEVLEKAEGNQVSNYSKFNDIKVKTSSGLVEVKNEGKVKATDTFQQLSFSNAAVKGGMIEEIRKYGYHSDPSKNVAYIIRQDRTHKGYFRVKNICKEDKYVRVTKNELDELLIGTQPYVGFTSTNAEMKKSNESALNLNHFDADDLLNELSFGALYKAKKKIEKGKTIGLIDLAKAAPRFGQQKSPSGKLEACLDMYGYLILNKSITMFDFKEYDYEGNKQSKDYEGYNVIDGSCFTREDYEAVLLSVKLIQKGMKVIVDPKATRGGQTQCRIWTFKGTKLAKRFSQFKRLLENIEDKYEEGKDYFIVGNRDNIVNIMDTDTIKSVFGELPDFGKYVDAKLFVMSLAKPSVVGTSKFQMLNKLVGCSDIPLDSLLTLVKQMAVNTAQKDYSSILGDVDKKSSIVKIDSINSGFVNDILSDMTNGRANHRDLSLSTKTLRNLDNTIKNKVNGLRLDVEGKSSYGMLAHDTTALMVRPKYRKKAFGEEVLGLIGYKEVFSKDWNNKVVKPYKAARMNEAKETAALLESMQGRDVAKAFLKATRDNIKKELKDSATISRKCFMVKFPAPGLNEVYKATLLTEDDIKERAYNFANKLHEIDDSVNIEKEARLLADNIIDSTPGTIIMPALEPLKAFLAGFDDDGDAAALVWHEKLAELFLSVKDIMVDIDTKDMGDGSKAVNRIKKAKDSTFDMIRNAQTTIA